MDHIHRGGGGTKSKKSPSAIKEGGEGGGRGEGGGGGEKEGGETLVFLSASVIKSRQQFQQNSTRFYTWTVHIIILTGLIFDQILSEYSLDFSPELLVQTNGNAHGIFFSTLARAKNVYRKETPKLLF